MIQDDDDDPVGQIRDSYLLSFCLNVRSPVTISVRNLFKTKQKVHHYSWYLFLISSSSISHCPRPRSPRENLSYPSVPTPFYIYSSVDLYYPLTFTLLHRYSKGTSLIVYLSRTPSLSKPPNLLDVPSSHRLSNSTRPQFSLFLYPIWRPVRVSNKTLSTLW